MKTIEQVEKERDEILAKALRAVSVIRGESVYSTIEQDEICRDIEALRPKPKPLECWLELNQYGGFEGYWSSEPNKDNLKRGHYAVHMREVTPAPKWERWGSDSAGVVKTESGRSLTGYVGTGVADTLCETHNAEMERLAALWEGGSDE